MTSDAPLTRESLRRVHPIVTPTTVPRPPDRVWTADEWERIKLGRRARDMDEKWNAFAGGGRKITAALVETDPQRHRRQGDDHDRLMLELVLGAIVLGEPAADLRAALANLVPSAPAGVIEHSALGAAPRDR